MKVSILLHLLLSSPFCSHAEFIRGGSSLQTKRQLMATHDHGFSALPCNDNIGACVDWSQQSFEPENGVVVIPCGTCVVMDASYDDSTLSLPNGLDIQGKLVIPDNFKIEIHTPFVLVQGELEMTSTAATTGEENIKFVLTGDQVVQRAPHAHNAEGCDNGLCNFGVKPVAVAGGALNIQGLPDNCPTWANLEDIVTLGVPDALNLPTYTAPAEGCFDEIISTDFENNQGISWPSGWYRNYGGTDSYQVDTDGNSYALFGGRTSSWNGPQTNFAAECIVPGVTYFISAKARLTKPGGTSNCQATGSNCLKLTTFMEDSDIGKRWNNRGAGGRHNDGEWYEFVSTMQFLEKDADASTAVARRFYWEGPEPGVEIALDDVRIFRAPSSSFPDPDNLGDVCTELITNGDAEDLTFGSIPYPFSAKSGVLKIDPDESGNRFFALRSRSYSWATPKYDLLPDCIQAGSIYSFSVDIRVHSESTQKLRFEIKSTSSGGQNDYKWLVICPEQSASDGFVTCTADWEFSSFQAEASSLELYAVSFQSGYEDILCDIDFDNYSFSFKSGPVRSLVLPDPSGTVASCWGAGSEILVTSNSIKFDDVYTRSIASVVSNADQTATITLNEPIPPTSATNSEPDYPVEVALLSRNIVFEGADTDSASGGHLIVYHTSRPQTLDGAAFVKFGQQGNLGRYPVHFHMCGSSIGSVVSRNLVLQSNQRCYVMHGTHDVTLDSNVAFDTRGHCFMLEDHSEQGNQFLNNLAAVTRKVDVKIRDQETDEFPSSFWISNPENSFVGNVAAGSEHSGFWFEMKDSVRGPSAILQNMDGSFVYSGYKPKEAPLTLFQGNVAHSNYEHGIKTYPGTGYKPIGDPAVFLDTKSFRNSGKGVFIHNSYNIKIVGGLFADNRVQIDIDRSPTCEIDGASIIGFSDEYRFYTEAMNSNYHCPSSYPIRGIEIHTYWTGGSTYTGTKVSNTSFSNFGNTGCADSSAIRVDTENKGYFDIRSAVSGLTFDEDSLPLSACDAKASLIQNFALRDTDGSIMGQPGFIVADSPQMTQFASCTTDLASCTAHCSGQCFRTIALSVSTFEDDNLELEITDQSSGDSVSIKSFYDWPLNSDGSVNVAEHTKTHRNRLFFAVLPSAGDYSVRFMLDGQEHWPVYVKTDYEDPESDCPEFSSFDVNVPGGESCDELISNGDMEDGIDGWWATMGGVVSVDESASGQGLALTSEYRTAYWMGPAQYLDTRCMTLGTAYSVTAKVKLVSKTTGEPVTCSLSPEYTCPKIILYLESGAHEDRDQAWHLVGSVSNDWITDGWNTLEGSFTVQEHYVAAGSVMIYFEAKEYEDALIVIDDVSIQPQII